MPRSAPSTDLSRHHALLEREAEVASLHEVLEDAKAGQGRLLVIEGPAGIGKSALLEVARGLAEERGMCTLRARGSELERAYPFGLVSSLLGQRFAKASDEEQGTLLRAHAALAAPLLAPAPMDVHPASPADEFSLIHGLHWAVVNLADDRPLVLLVDDVHWADELSLRFLVYLAQRLDELPVALVVAVRTGDPSAASELVTTLTVAQPGLRPAELSVEAVRKVLASEDLGGAGLEDVAGASWEATRGNPFLLTELVAAIRQDSAAALQAARADGDFAPQAVGRNVVLRLRRLGDDAFAVARACAVLGDDTPLILAATLAGLEAEVAAVAAEQLVTAQILTNGQGLAFAHPMIRSAVAAELGPGEGPRAHLHAARLLHERGAAAAEVANHLAAGVPCEEPWALEALHEAGREAARKGAPATAARYLRRALELDPGVDRAGAMLVDLGLAEAASGEATALDRLSAALKRIDDPAGQARALYAIGRTLYRYGRHVEAADTFQRGADLLGGDADLALWFEASALCCSIQSVSLHDDAMRRGEELQAAVPATGPTTKAQRTLLAVVSLHRALSLPPADQAAAMARAALGDGVLLAEETAESMAVNLAVMALTCCGRGEEAQVAADAVLADARARGALLAFAEGSMVRAMASFSRGRLDEALADAQAAMRGMDQGWHALVPIPQSLVAQCLIEKGDLPRAEAVLQDVEPHIPDEALGVKAAYLCARGQLHLAQGHPAEALEDLEAAGAGLERYRVVSPIPVAWRVPAGMAALAVGDGKRARDLVERELAAAKDFGLPGPLGAAMCARAVLRGHPLTELEDAVAVLEDADAPLELARALLELGGALRRSGRRVDCRIPLRRALELAHRCGASALEERVLGELHSSGSRPRRAVFSGLDALTPSERRIADLVAEGLTNRAVAETLFLTKGTVEWHLKHIYSKLGIRSRETLTEMIEERRAEVEDPAAGQTPSAAKVS